MLNLYQKKMQVEAHRHYYENPNRCNYCDTVIPITMTSYEARKKKYCNRSCAGKANKDIRKNNRVPRHGLIKGAKSSAKIQKEKTEKGYYENPSYCLYCKKMITPKEGRYWWAKERQKYCNTSCSKKDYWQNNPYTVKDLLNTKRAEKQIKELTREKITKHAQLVWKASNKPEFCILCKEDRVFEVAHIIAVTSFNEDTFLYVVNHPINLTTLCPTCHDLYDKKKLITKEEIEKAIQKLSESP